MTSNQKQALQLAESILNRSPEPTPLSDEQWQLLLLASGMNYCRSNPVAISQRTIDNYLNCEGYFANCSPRPFNAPAFETPREWGFTIGARRVG